MLAASHDRVEIVQLLLNAGAPVNDKDIVVHNQSHFSFFCQNQTNYIHRQLFQPLFNFGDS